MSDTLPLGSPPPNFRLKATDGNYYTLHDFSDVKALIIFFTCNHCFYVTGSNEITRKTAEKFKDKGAVFIGINSNSVVYCPEDSFDKMVQNMEIHHFPWYYLYDEKQEVARQYGALRTPHFFIFDHTRHLIYTGRGTDSPKDPSKMTINDLENTLEDYFAGRPVRKPLTDPIGCTIKWQRHDTTQVS